MSKCPDMVERVTPAMLDAAYRAFGDTEIVGGPPSFTKRALANAICVALEASHHAELVEALQTLATFDFGSRVSMRKYAAEVLAKIGGDA